MPTYTFFIHERIVKGEGLSREGDSQGRGVVKEEGLSREGDCQGRGIVKGGGVVKRQVLAGGCKEERSPKIIIKRAVRICKIHLRG